MALVCDYLKGNNEQLREHNIELRVRKEEQERRLLLDPAGFLGQMLPAQNQTVARQAHAAARPAAAHEVMQSFATAEALAEADERAARLHARTGDETFESADVPPMTQRRGGRKGAGRAGNRGNRKDGEKYADWVRPEVIARVARRAEASAAYSSDIRDDLDASREESLPAPLNAPEVPDIRQDLPVRAKARKESEPVASAPKEQPKIAIAESAPVPVSVPVETRPVEPVAVEPAPPESLPERLSPEDATKLQREIERVAYLERQPLAPAPGTILRPLTVPTLKLEEEIQRVAEQEPVAAQPSALWHSALLDEVIANSANRSSKPVPVPVVEPVVVEQAVHIAVVADPVAVLAEVPLVEVPVVEVAEEILSDAPVEIVAETLPAEPGPSEITLDPNGYMESAPVSDLAPPPVIELLPEPEITAAAPVVEETPRIEPEPVVELELVPVASEPVALVDTEPVVSELSIEVAVEPFEPELVAVLAEPELAGSAVSIEVPAEESLSSDVAVPVEAPVAEPELVFAEVDATPLASYEPGSAEAVEPPPIVFLVEAEEPVVPFAQLELEPEIAEPVAAPIEFAAAPEPPPFVFDLEPETVPTAIAEPEPPVLWLDLQAPDRQSPVEAWQTEPAHAEQIFSYYNFQPRASHLAGMGISPVVEFIATIPALEPPLASFALSEEPALTAFVPSFVEEEPKSESLPDLLPAEPELTWEAVSPLADLGPLPAFASVEPPPFWVDEPVVEAEPAPVTALARPIDINALRQPEPVVQAPAPVQIPDLLLPTGMHDLSTWSRLMSLPNPMTGILFVISLQPSEKASSPGQKGSAAIDENGPAIDKLMASFVREGDFGTRISDTEWVFIYSNDVAGFNQRRVGLISEKLWDFQLRHLGMANVSFKWGAIDVQSEPLPAALEAARDRMNQTRRARKLPGADAASPRRVVNG